MTIFLHRGIRRHSFNLSALSHVNNNNSVYIHIKYIPYILYIFLNHYSTVTIYFYEHRIRRDAMIPIAHGVTFRQL